MIEQHLDGGCDLLARKLVHGVEDPKCLSQHEMGYPSALADELFSRANLTGIITRHEANKDVRVNREHAAGECAFGLRPSRQVRAWPLGCPLETEPDACRTS